VAGAGRTVSVRGVRPPNLRDRRDDLSGHADPLPVWFRAMWWVTTQKNGASALGLQRVLGLKSYETAWAWLHKLRRAMVRPGRDMLTGRVEVDECYVGGPEDGLVGRLNLDKALVVVAAQEDGPASAGFACARSRMLPPIAWSPLCGSRGVRKHRAYGRMAGISAAEELRIQARGDVPEGEREERVGAAAARSSGDLAPETVDAGNPSGAISHKHLDYYLDEFTFRFNRRRSKSRGKLFFRLAQQAVAVDPVTLDQIIHPDAKEKTKPQPVGPT